MRVTILASLVLTALTTTVAARAHVPRSLLVGLKRQAETSPVVADLDGECPDNNGQSLCGGEVGGGCCADADTHCEWSEDQSVWTCAPNTSEPAPEVEGTEPTPDENGICKPGSDRCPMGGCCETDCLAVDAEQTTFVCAIPEEAPPPEETTSTEDIVSETPAPRPPPTGNNNPTPTRTPNRSTTSSRSTGSAPTTAPGDGAGSITGKSAAVVAGFLGAMMALA